MKHLLYIFKFTSLASLILVLCACNHLPAKNQENTGVQQSEITITAATTVADPAAIQSSIIAEQQASTQAIDSAIVLDSSIPWVTLDDVMYLMRKNSVAGSNQLCIHRIRSSSEHTVVPHDIPEYGKVIYVAADSLILDDAQTLTFSEGIRGIDLNNSSDQGHYADNLLEIFFPSTMTVLIGKSRDPLQTSSLNTTNTFPTYFPSLQKIHVAESNPIYQSDNGVLYQDDQLICIPQDYQTADGNVKIREGTTDLRDRSIYRCRNIKRLIVPDSVQNIHLFAITPYDRLTIVCSRDSAAAAYVKERNYPQLTVEFTD